MTYLFLKWIHVLAAVVALGTNLTYTIWLLRANHNPESLLFTLRTIKLLDDRVANPAYVVSLITGVGMVFVSGMSFTTPWLLLSLILYVLVVLIGLFGYTPTLARQIRAAENGVGYAAAYTAVARRATILGGIIVGLVIIIVLLMVMKPPLWG